MPAKRLHDSVFSIRKFDVAGQDAAVDSEFVRHVGLSDEHHVEVKSRIGLVHMGPPLERARARVQTMGTANLTSDQVRQIGVFIERLELEYQADKVRGSRQYVIYPHVREPDEEIPFRRFNCAGFVIEAYRFAGIDLLVTDDDRLPRVSSDTLIQAYPDKSSVINNKRLREKYGLKGDEPWPVVLAGYVLNGLDRSKEDILREPYQPSPGDEFFPSTA